MILCDLCGQSKECEQREIEGREYDICAKCWNLLARKLKGKGRVKQERETVFLPPLLTPAPAKPKEPEPPPAGPPNIWSGAAVRAES